MTVPTGVQTAPVTPATADAPAQPNQPNQRGANARAGGAPQMPTGFFYPRWVLLGTMVVIAVALVGYAVHYYYSARAVCSLGSLQSLCSLDLIPDWAKFVVAVVGYLLALWIAATYGRTLGPESAMSEREGFARLVVRLTEYQRVRLLTRIIAALLALGLALDFLLGRLDGMTAALTCITLFACLRAGFYRPRRAPAAREGVDAAQAEHEQQLGQQSRFWSVARNTPPLSYIFRTRHR